MMLSDISQLAPQTMKIMSIVLLCLLFNVCHNLRKKQTWTRAKGQRRRSRPEGRDRTSFLKAVTAREAIPSSNHHRSPKLAPNINAEQNIVTMLDSYIGAENVESTYNVLPGKEGHCKANGMIMYDKAVWSPKPCVICMCSNGNVACDEMSCATLTCARTTVAAGECCPHCIYMEPSDSILPSSFSNHNLLAEPEEPLSREELEVEEELHITFGEHEKRKDKKAKDEERKEIEEVLLREEEMLRQVKEEPQTVLQEQQQQHLESEAGPESGAGPENEVSRESETSLEWEARLERERKREEQLEEMRNLASIEEDDEYEVDEEEEDEYEEDDYEEEEDEGFSILDSDLYDTDDEIVPFSMPVGCDISDVIMNCNNARLTQIPHLRVPELKSLNLQGNVITTISANAFSGIPNVEWIDLSRNKILSSNIHPNAFRKLKKLQRLNMDGNLLQHISTEFPPALLELKLNENRLKWLDEESFHDLNNLVTLELEGNNISESNVAPTTFTPCKKLTYLRLGKNRFRTVPQSLPPTLQELYLEDNEIEEISEAVFNKTTNLNMIVLRNNKLDESRIAPLAWMNLENLESLDLSHNRIVHVPSFLPRGLIHLVLIYNQIERIPAFVFAHLEPGLEYLYLSVNKLTSDGIDPTSFFGTYYTLRELFLDENKIKTIPFGLADMKALHFLRLNNNLIRTVPLESFCNENDQEDSNIRALHLENNFINRRKIPRTAFSCIQSYSSVVLRPQKVKH